MCWKFNCINKYNVHGNSTLPRRKRILNIKNFRSVIIRKLKLLTYRAGHNVLHRHVHAYILYLMVAPSQTSYKGKYIVTLTINIGIRTNTWVLPPLVFFVIHYFSYADLCF